MRKIHVQAELEPREYEAWERAVAAEGLKAKDAAREALLQWARHQQATTDPFFEVIGMVNGKVATDHDDIYEADWA